MGFDDDVYRRTHSNHHPPANTSARIHTRMSVCVSCQDKRGGYDLIKTSNARVSGHMKSKRQHLQ